MLHGPCLDILPSCETACCAFNHSHALPRPTAAPIVALALPRPLRLALPRSHCRAPLRLALRVTLGFCADMDRAAAAMESGLQSEPEPEPEQKPLSSSILGAELIMLADCDPSICDQVLAGQPESILSMTTEQLGASDDALFLRLLGAMTRMSIPGESKQDILAKEPRAIFTYGTLRADMTPTGDSCGVMEKLEGQGFAPCAWQYGRVYGYSLFQAGFDFFARRKPQIWQ